MAKGLPKTANVTRFKKETDEEYWIRRMVTLARHHLNYGTGELYPAAKLARYGFPEGVVTLWGEHRGSTASWDFVSNEGESWGGGFGNTVGLARRCCDLEVKERGETCHEFPSIRDNPRYEAWLKIRPAPRDFQERDEIEVTAA